MDFHLNCCDRKDIPQIIIPISTKNFYMHIDNLLISTCIFADVLQCDKIDNENNFSDLSPCNPVV